MHKTLDAMTLGCRQPLAREAYFHIILLGLRIVRHCTTLPSAIKWRLKDRILTVALAWFAKAPEYVFLICFDTLTNLSRWSIGGNRVQIKAETHILSDIQSYLEVLSRTGIAPEGPLKSPKAKQDLLSLLISNEQTRLMVWLFPLDYNKKHHFTSGQHSKALTDVSTQAQPESRRLTWN